MEWTSVQPDKVLCLYEFVQEHRKICDAHTVDFFTEGHWDRVIPEVWRDDLLSLHDFPASVFLNPETMEQSHLRDFLCKAKQLKFPLSEGGVDDCSGEMQGPTPIDRFGMTEKKAHEVKRMAAQIKSIAEQLSMQQVIDIGSGKGYLSEYLSFVHGLRVYGIDSSAINREGAMDRSRKVQKYFGKLRANTPPASKHEITGSIKTDVVTENDSDDHQERILLRNVDDITTEKCIKDGQSNEHGNEQDGWCGNGCHDENPPTKGDSNLDGISFNGFFKPITHFIEDTDNILALVHTDGCGCHGDYHSDHQPSILTGLHTCGDLACVGLKQFVSNEMMRALCLVGCCYHHITETGSNPGFPMSEFLKSKDGVVGRKTLMLACQSEGRFSSVTSGSSLMSVFYRAVLQVIFRDEMKIFKSKEDALLLCIGRIKKYSSFVEYCRKAMNRLDIPMDGQPSDKVLMGFHERYLPSLVKVQRYLQIRAAISLVIESLIIADRLLYLKEQKVKKAWAVQLFSPSISPRCVGLCAYK